MEEILEVNTYCFKCKKPTETIERDDKITVCNSCGMPKKLQYDNRGVPKILLGQFAVFFSVLIIVFGLVVWFFWWVIGLFN